MDFLENEYYGNCLESWGISLLIILGALILNKGIVLLNRYILLKLAAKSKSRLDNILFKTLEKPVLLGIMLASIWIASCRLVLNPSISSVIAKSYQLLTVLNITWFFARFVIAILEEHACSDDNKPQKGFRVDIRLLPVVKRITLILIWIIGIMTALSHAGVRVTTMLGTLGIGGIAFALAAQDTIKNIFGGVTIFTDRPFRIGDIIQYNSIEGTVRDIGLRSTRIQTYDKRLVTIPNSNMMDAAVINVSSEPGRRVVMTLGLTYDTDFNQMQNALNILKGLPDVVLEIHHKDLSATFSDFGDSSLNITYIYFIRKSADIRETISKVNFEILRRFNGAGLDFAYPTQTVYLGNKV
jgi:MscS family membrane protein